MSGIRGKNTRPELEIRKALFGKGFRYRLHVRNLPGKPDIVFPKHKAVLFVHGCFWHGHHCPLFKLPSTRRKFWQTKISRNRRNDSAAIKEVRARGWRVGVIWECSLKGPHRLERGNLISRIERWLLSQRTILAVSGTAGPALIP